MKLNMSTKIAAFTGALILVISVALGYVSITKSSSTIITQAQTSIGEYAKSSALFVAARIETDIKVFQELANRARVMTMDWNTQQGALVGDIDVLGYLDIGVVLPDGTTTYIKDGTTAQLSDSAYVKTALGGKANISNVFISSVTKKAIVVEAVPIKQDGKVVGALIGIRDAEYLGKITDSLGIGTRGYAFLIGQDGTINAHKNRDLVKTQRNVINDIAINGDLKEFGLAFQKVGAGNSGITNYPYLGDVRLSYVIPVVGTPWILGIGNYQSDYLKPVDLLKNQIIIFALILVLIGVFLALLLGKMIADPAKKTLLMIKEMSLGRFGMRLNMKSKDEIGQLANTMDKFADILQFELVGVIKQIAAGNVSINVVPKDEKDEISPALILTINSIRALIADANMLATAAIEGRLDTRADASKHGGDFAKIVDGVNQTLDAVIKPVQEAAYILDEMAAGNLKKRMVGNYQGDHAAIKNALNGTLDALEGYVNEISDTLTEMANSNMALSINGDYKGDFTPIKEALNLIIESFNQVLSDMNNAADQVAAGSRQVSDGSQELSQGATEQARAIEELTSSISDIAAKTKENAMRANEASELAVTAKERAEQGNNQMQALQKAMEEINLSSTNISKIIKVIDDIAFQTNILALNAAVEAARAGQHGKGFAVVAEEVRNLAARSANAANETTVLIEGSIKKVTVGTTIADGTAKALEQIVMEVTKAATLVGAIAEASNEQANNITQINQGVEQVSQVVQSNSATAEQSAAASEELSSQADLLKEMIGQFQLKAKTTSRANNRLSDDFVSMQSDIGNSRTKSPVAKNKPKAKQTIALTSNEFGKY